MTIIRINNTRLVLRDDGYAKIRVQMPMYFAVLSNDYYDGHHFGLEDTERGNWKHPVCVHKDQLREFVGVQWVEVLDASDDILARFEFACAGV